MSHEVYKLTPEQTGPGQMPGLAPHFKWAVVLRRGVWLDFVKAFRLRREAEHYAALRDEEMMESAAAKEEAERSLRAGARRVFAVIRTIGVDSQAIAVAFTQAAAEEEVTAAAARDERVYGACPWMDRSWKSSYAMVELPIVPKRKEPCGVCNGAGCAECNPDR